MYNKVLSKICEYKSTTSHCLLELSQKQWRRIHDRSINLSDMSVTKVDNGKVQYKSYKLGENLRFQNKKGHSSGKFLQWKSPALANINGGYIAIIGNKIEFLQVNPDLIVVDGSNQELLQDNMNDETVYQPSGILVLCIARLERDKIRTAYKWNAKDANTISTCKTNIITAHSTHYGSTGDYYCFGNRANYGLIDK